jgi:hypothetical protein
MYRVYSQQKPAPAWRGPVATALILMACVGAGWLLIERKQAGRPVGLDEPADLEGMHLRLRPPKGWPKDTRQVGEIDVTTFEEPTRGPGRTLWVMSWAAGYAPAMQRSIVLQPKLARVGLGLYHPSGLGGPAPLGPLAGWSAGGLWAGSKSQGSVLNRVAWSPNGRTYLITLSTPDRLRQADWQFVDAVCQSVEITNLRLTDDLQRAGEATGIQFALPTDARVVDPNDYETARVTLIGAPDGRDDWLIRVFRTWPRADGGLESLVAACRIEQIQDMTPARHIDEKHVGVNHAWHSSARLPEGWSRELQTGLEIWAVRHRDGPAAMIVGESPASSLEALRERCTAIARSLRLTSTPLTPNADEARRIGEQIVAEIRKNCIGHWWSRSKTESWFHLDIYGDRGFIWRRRGPAEADDGRPRRFEGGGISYVRYGVGRGRRDRDDVNRWWIDTDTTGFLFKQYVPPLDEDDKPVRLSDQRRPASDEVRHYIEVEAQRYQGTLTTPADFLPDPIFELGLYLVARRPAGQCALFTGMGSSEKMMIRRMCRSLGRLEGQDDGEGGPVYGVLAQLDYESTPTRYVFDEKGEVVRVERGSYYVALRSSRSAIEDRLDDASVVDKALQRWEKADWLRFGTQGSRPTTKARQAAKR